MRMKLTLLILSMVSFVSSTVFGQLELRDAAYEPVEGWEKRALDANKGKKIVYVGNEILLAGEFVEEVSISPTTSYFDGKSSEHYVIVVVLTEEGGNRMREITRSRISKPLAIMVGGELCSAPTIMSELSRRFHINVPTKEEAERIKKAIHNQAGDDNSE